MSAQTTHRAVLERTRLTGKTRLPPRHPATLLLFDRQLHRREKLAAELQSAGFSICQTDSEREAAQHFAGLAAAGAVLVIESAESATADGLTLCRTLQTGAQAAGAFVILVGAPFTTAAGRVQGLEAGAAACLADPVAPAELRAHLQSLVQRQRRQAAERRGAAKRERAQAVVQTQLDRTNVALEQKIEERTLALAEANLRVRQGEERLKLALTASHTGVWEWELSTNAVFWSPECFEITGSSAFNGTLESFTRLLHPEDAPRLWDAVQKALASRAQFVCEFRIVRADGRVRWLSNLGRATYDTAGKPLRLLGTVRDITQRKEVEQALRTSQEELRALAGRLQAVREMERARVAREIHDVLAQELTCLKMELASLKGRLRRPLGQSGRRYLRERLEEMNAAANRAIESVQNLATELRPVILDSLGLSAAIEWLAEDFTHRTGIPCAADVPPKPLSLDRDRSTALFRILQESLTNVLRHAAAKQVQVRLQCQPDRVTLQVQDDGLGMAEAKLNDPRSLGLVGMRERALLLDGRCLITSRPGAGTRVEVSFQLPPAGDGAR